MEMVGKGEGEGGGVFGGGGGGGGVFIPYKFNIIHKFVHQSHSRTQVKPTVCANPVPTCARLLIASVPSWTKKTKTKVVAAVGWGGGGGSVCKQHAQLACSHQFSWSPPHSQSLHTTHTDTQHPTPPPHPHTHAANVSSRRAFQSLPPDGWLAGAVSSCGRSGRGGSCGSSRRGLSGDDPGAGSCDRWARWTGLEGSAPGGKASAHLLKTGTALLANENSRCLSGWDVPLKAVQLPHW